MADGEFAKQTIETIAKRAGNLCSNPDCGVLTCGPADDADRAVILGEAAHIFGVRAGAARYEEAMSAHERAASTNGLWLCRNCHKLVDADPIHYPAPILFEWRRLHEADIATRLGKPSDVLRQKVILRQLEGFVSCSYLAQQIVIDKPKLWQFSLTAELLRNLMLPTLKQWRALERGLYTKAMKIIVLTEIDQWIQARFDETKMLSHAFSGLINEELPRALGVLDTPGNENEILGTCELLAACAKRTVEWEEFVRFATVPDEYREVQRLLVGGAGMITGQLARLPGEIAAILENPTGLHNIRLVVEPPGSWEGELSRAISNAVYATEARK